MTRIEDGDLGKNPNYKKIELSLKAQDFLEAHPFFPNGNKKEDALYWDMKAERLEKTPSPWS